MAGEVFRGGMNHDVGAQIERLLQVWRDEGVVDDHDGAVLVRDLGDGVHVVDLQQRVRERLEIDRLRRGLLAVSADRMLQLAQVLCVHRVADEPPTVEMLVEQRVGAAVDVRADHNALARCEDRQHCMDRREP